MKQSDGKKVDKGGRPPKYNGETIKKAQEYIDSCVDDIDIDEKGRPVTIKVNLPKAEGLALYLGVRRETLYDWAKKHKGFSNVLESLNQRQAQKLIDSGLSGTYNSTIAKLVLAKHGYKENLNITNAPDFDFDEKS